MKMNKILFLPLKKEWYELIEKGIKTEEYRKIKPYWIRRLIIRKYKGNIMIDASFRDFEEIRFSYGYTKRTMTFKCDGIEIGKGKPEWGSPKEEVFIIKLGLRLI